MHPLLAAFSFESLFAIGFVLVTVIGWIMNLINSQNPPPQPNRPAEKPRPRDRQVQTEIEEFLQQAMGRRGPQKAKGPADGIEIIEPKPARRPPAPRPSQAANAGPTSAAGPQSDTLPPNVRPGESIAARHSVGSLDPGTGIRAHVEEHMNSRVGQHVQADLPHTIAASISQHLGEFRATAKDPRQSVAPIMGSHAAVSGPTELLADIRRPSGMRKAVIMQEVLSKPRALRKH